MRISPLARCYVLAMKKNLGQSIVFGCNGGLFVKNTIILPDTINLHFTSHCNACCGFCFAEYEGVNKYCSVDNLKKIILLIAEKSSIETPKRVNFVGGEPTIHKELPDLLSYAKNCGLKTSLVTNGLVMLQKGINAYADDIDMIGLSIDSIDPSIVKRVGRYNRVSGYIPTKRDWLRLAKAIHKNRITLKINTVVNRLNYAENMCDFVSELSPAQWKLFQVTRVLGQNEARFADWEITSQEFGEYCKSPLNLMKQGVRVTPEPSELMINSYAMIGPNGCFVDNAEGKHVYSQPILEVGIDEAWSQTRFDHKSFNARRKTPVTDCLEANYAKN